MPDSLIFIRSHVGMIALFHRGISQSTNEEKVPLAEQTKKGPLVQRGLSAKRSDADWGIGILIIL